MANMNTSGNDLRFYDINNNVCSYWIEIWNNTGTSTIWVKVATSGATALYLYYGNAAAPAASNGPLPLISSMILQRVLAQTGQQLRVEDQ